MLFFTLHFKPIRRVPIHQNVQRSSCGRDRGPRPTARRGGRGGRRSND